MDTTTEALVARCSGRSFGCIMSEKGRGGWSRSFLRLMYIATPTPSAATAATGTTTATMIGTIDDEAPEDEAAPAVPSSALLTLAGDGGGVVVPDVVGEREGCPVGGVPGAWTAAGGCWVITSVGGDMSLGTGFGDKGEAV